VDFKPYMALGYRWVKEPGGEKVESIKDDYETLAQARVRVKEMIKTCDFVEVVWRAADTVEGSPASVQRTVIAVERAL